MTFHKREKKSHVWSILENIIYIENCKFGKGEEAILDLLMEYYAGEEHAIHLFLTSPRIPFSGKTALDIINTREGQILISDHIFQLQTGDLA